MAKQNIDIQYNLSPDAMNKVMRQFNAMKAAGIQVQPWQLEQMWKEEYNKQGAKETSDLAFGKELLERTRQQDLDRAERLRQFNMGLGEKARQFDTGLGEKQRQFNLGLTEDQRRLQNYIDLSEEARSDAEEMGKWRLGGNFLSNLIGGLKTKKTGGY